MAQENKPLQVRAGLNIGIEPDLGLFMQDGGGREKTLNTSAGAENVILECPEGTARTPIPLGAASGLIFNTMAITTFAYITYFQDELGNEIPLNVTLSISGETVEDFNYHDGRLNQTGFCLTPGQKIILRPVPGD